MREQAAADPGNVPDSLRARQSFRCSFVDDRHRSPSRAPRRPADPGRLRLPAGDAGQRNRAGEKAQLGPSRRVLSAYDDRRVGTRGRPAARADGQLRGRPSQHRRGPRRLPGLHAHRSGDRGRRIRAQSRADRRDRSNEGRRIDASHPGARVARRRPQPRAADRRHGGARRRPAARRGCASTHSSTAATRRRAAPRRRSRTSKASAPGTPTRGLPRSSAATTRWTAMGAGIASRPRTTLSSMAARLSRRTRRKRRSRPPTRAARTTSSSRPRRSTAGTAKCRRWRTATSSCS